MSFLIFLFGLVIGLLIGFLARNIGEYLFPLHELESLEYDVESEDEPDVEFEPDEDELRVVITPLTERESLPELPELPTKLPIASDVESEIKKEAAKKPEKPEKKGKMTKPPGTIEQERRERGEPRWEDEGREDDDKWAEEMADMADMLGENSTEDSGGDMLDELCAMKDDIDSVVVKDKKRGSRSFVSSKEKIKDKVQSKERDKFPEIVTGKEMDLVSEYHRRRREKQNEVKKL